jgi:hypothetical protein
MSLAKIFAKPNPTENAEHLALADWLRIVEKQIDGFWWTTIPLGGGGKIRGGQIKAAGARKGTPDVLCIWKGRPFFIELKRRKGGKVTPEQRDCHKQILKAGGGVYVAYGWTAARDFIETAIDQINRNNLGHGL